MLVGKIDAFARKYPRSQTFLFSAAVVGGIAGLFVFDVSAPRGEVDGIGYAAMVALTMRFGNRPVIACAVLTTVLTLVAALAVPDAGISVAGMWANRICAIVEIWIVAAILVHRLELEAYVADRQNILQKNQASLRRVVREGLLADKSPDEQLDFITEECAEALGSDFCIIFERPDLDGPIRISNIWDRRRRRHFEGPPVPDIDRATYLKSIDESRIIYANDVRTSDFHRPRLAFFEQLGIRAMMSAATVQEPGRGTISFAFEEPHTWSEEEFAFARSAASLTSLSFAVRRNAQTLAALEQVGEGIILEGKNGEIRYANRAARELPGYMPERGFAGSEGPLKAASDMQVFSLAGRCFEVQRLRLPDSGILTRVNDVTERLAALAERRALEDRLQRGAKMEAIGQLAGGVAHDFNNILGAILGFAGLLAQDLADRPAERAFAERILNACQRGKHLVEQIMTFARVRAIERGTTDLALAVNRNQDYLSGLLPAELVLRIHSVGTVSPILGSAVQIGQLVENLVLNARDAMAGKAGAVDVTVQPVPAEAIEQLGREVDTVNERSWGEVRPSQSYVLLRVEDEGSGIPAELLDRIFEPFFTTKGRQHGTGLGLAVVHGVVESLGGICHVRSIPGSGTVFSVYFPLVDQPRAQTDSGANPLMDFHGKERILIVDDEADIADMLSIGLERLGYETVSVNDPKEALAAFAEDPMAFDLVITDQVMPGLSGLELIRHIKEIRPEMQAILCSGYSEEGNQERGREGGADAILQKPVDALHVATGIRRVLEGRGLLNPASL